MRRPIALAAAVLLGSCAVPEGSDWHLLDEGYAIRRGENNAVAIQMHVNQLKRIGGDVNSVEFNLFVAERLKWHGLCGSGWTVLPCVQDGSCVERTRYSLTVPGRCRP